MATKNYYTSSVDIAKLLYISSKLYRLFGIVPSHDLASYFSRNFKCPITIEYLAASFRMGTFPRTVSD